jgi:hypothetical protein
MEERMVLSRTIRSTKAAAGAIAVQLRSARIL